MNLTTILPTLAAAAGEKANPLDHVVDWPIWRTDGGLWLLTNHMVMILLAAGLMLLIFPAITRRYRDGEANVSELLNEQSRPAE